MDTTTPFLGLLIVGVVLGGVFVPVANRRWPTLVSEYPKADLEKRTVAALVDAGICATLFGLLVIPLGFPVASVLSPFYLLVRDRVVPGQSIGKLLVGLVVIELESGLPCGALGSIRRNIVFVVPGFNLVAIPFESRAAQQDTQGMRLGDRLARTQVVEGKDAKELVKRLSSWLLEWLVPRLAPRLDRSSSFIADGVFEPRKAL